ncbi:uncharacterized protein LOC132192554 [Neocloeon triangulifer]|uniref:uncharacterized protein LOC132192554 n=1 Tax=Neocloeon triangulifer TaxID=2078957 RepID=UPI00286ECCD9|nr:uncharacterized protein LOC132192554 [Neocloeon triangulifer]
MANTMASLSVIALLCSLQMVASFNVDRDEEGYHNISKRQTPSVPICYTQLMDKAMCTSCKGLPSVFCTNSAELTKCVATAKAKTAAAAEAVCLADCTLKAQKLTSATGVDEKLVTAYWAKQKLDKTWLGITNKAIAPCVKDANKLSAAKLASGYKTTCKTSAFYADACIRAAVIKSCPAASKQATYSTVEKALMACDYTAITKSTAQLAQEAMKKVDPKTLAAASKDPLAALALAKQSGLDMSSLTGGGKMDTNAMKDLAKKYLG